MLLKMLATKALTPQRKPGISTQAQMSPLIATLIGGMGAGGGGSLGSMGSVGSAGSGDILGKIEGLMGAKDYFDAEEAQKSKGLREAMGGGWKTGAKKFGLGLLADMFKRQDGSATPLSSGLGSLFDSHLLKGEEDRRADYLASMAPSREAVGGQLDMMMGGPPQAPGPMAQPAPPPPPPMMPEAQSPMPPPPLIGLDEMNKRKFQPGNQVNVGDFGNLSPEAQQEFEREFIEELMKKLSESKKSSRFGLDFAGTPGYGYR